MKNSLQNLETFTAALARNSEKIDNVMLKVDGVMGKADSLMLGLNTIAGGTAGGELNLMVKSIRELADDFDKRSGALMADGRRTLGDISRAVNNFDRNPSRVIFGGSNNAAPAAEAAAPPSRRQRTAKPAARRAGRSGSRNRLTQACGLTVRPPDAFTSRYRYSPPWKNDLTRTRSSRPWMRDSPMSPPNPECP